MGKKDKREELENASLDTERDKIRKKAKKRTVFSVIFMVVLIGVLVGLSGLMVKNLIEMAEGEDLEVARETFAPTAEIVDENGSGKISARVNEYVGQLESDLKDYGIKMTRVVLPMGKMREIDVNVEGISAYFKVNIDRGTAVSAEDIVKMKKYLEENALVEKVSYVDVRIEGKAYYK